MGGFIIHKRKMKGWPADWRKSLFYQPSSTSASSNEGRCEKSKVTSEASSSAEYVRNSETEMSNEEKTARANMDTERRGSVDYGNIEKARRDSTTYLQGERDSMDSQVSMTEMVGDIVSIRIPVEGPALAMYSEPRHIIHADMFNLVHASMWLWQEKSQRVLWANDSASEAHHVSPTQRVSMSPSLEYEGINVFKDGKGAFIRGRLREVENGVCMLYLKGLAIHILPYIMCNRRSEEETDIVEVVVKPYVLRGLHQSGDQRCCLVEVVNSLSKEAVRDVEMFQANTGNTFLVDLSGRLLCRKHSTPAFTDVKHMYDLLSGTQEEKDALMDDIHCRLFELRESSVYLTEQSDKDRRWASIEVKKSRDPVTYKAALFLSVSDVTDMKAAELTLIGGFHAIKDENDRFWDDQRQSLQLSNHEVLKSETKNMRRSVQLSPSPAEMVSDLLNELIDGNKVSRNRLMYIQEVFTGGAENCYEPINLRNDLSMDLDSGTNRVLWELLGEGQEDYRSHDTEENKVGRQWRRESLDMQNSSNSSEYKWYLSYAEKWDFDVFKFAEHTKWRPLTTLAMYLMEREGLITQFDIDKNVLRRYLYRIESGYPDNPYHNRIHACGVLHLTYMLITKGGMSKTDFQPLAILCCFLAAITHDYDHPGKTSDYLIRTENKLAILYNDTSPLENYHISSAWSLLMQPKYNFLVNVNDNVKKSIRETWIDLVMATDMKKHLGIVAQFKARTSPRHATTGSNASGAESGSESTNRIILKMLVKIADLGHLASPPRLHRRWVTLLEEEQFRQGDVERSENMSVSSFMDRTQDGISKSQPAFFEVIALPTFEAFSTVFDRTNILYERVKENYESWMREGKTSN